jgi:hypothetical protein
MTISKQRDKDVPLPAPFSRASSCGDSPIVISPKDVSDDYASARDITERLVHSPDLDVREEALLDDALDLSFPASDPISVPSYAFALAKFAALKKRNR